MSIDDQVLDQQVEAKEESKQVNQISTIEVNERGLVQAKNNAELLRYCNAMISSKQVPQWYTKPQELFAAIMFIRSLGLPDNAIMQTAVIQGRWSIFGDLPLALVQSSKDYDGIKEFWFDLEYNQICFENKNLNAECFGAVCFLKRKNHDLQSFAFTLDDAKKAGLYPSSNPSKPWAKYTKLMLRYRARSIAIKSLFADKLSGVGLGGYDNEYHSAEEAIKDVNELTAEKRLANELNTVET